MQITPELVLKFDKAGMLERVMATPAYLADALQRAQQTVCSLDAESLNGIVVAGMGGSAISGDVARALTLEALPVPMLVSRGYELPACVNARTLVIISSYSGNTEETLAAFHLARERGAQIVCVTSGGQIANLAADQGLPVFALPSGFPPRSALAYLIVPLLAILHRLGFIADPAADLHQACELLGKLAGSWGAAAQAPANPAQSIAAALANRIPIVYAASGLMEVAAWRWKEQFCENAEVLSWHNVFPELNHNELVGWGLRPGFDAGLQVIFLRDAFDHPRVQKRMELTRAIINASSAPVIEVWSQGQSRLARIFSLIFLGDLASVYLAILNRVDPTPVKKIDLLKERLAQLEG